jgi:hypothetical protein
MASNVVSIRCADRAELPHGDKVQVSRAVLTDRL